VNQPFSFTAKEIAENLDMPLRTVQNTLTKISKLQNIQITYRASARRGRKEKLYCYSEKVLGFYP